MTLAISVMGAALRLPHRFFHRNWRQLAIVLGPGMLLMWGATSALVDFALPVPWVVAILIGAALTPTDPVLSDAIVTGRNAERFVPARLRNMITAESGANDGLALLLVGIPLSFLTEPQHTWRHWSLVVVAWEVLLGAAIGAAIGWLAGRAVNWSHRQRYTDPTPLLTIGLALALTVLVIVKLAGSDGILAVFVAGAVFSHINHQHKEMKREHIEQAVGRFFDLPVFILLGAVLPFDAWSKLDNALGLAVAVLLFRRLPAWFILRRWQPALHSLADTLFNGWFGPTGVAALYYALLAVKKTGIAEVWDVVSLVVFLSILAHGVTATPAARIFGRWGGIKE